MIISVVVTLTSDKIIKDDQNSILLLSKTDYEHFEEITRGGHVLFGRNAANDSRRDLGNRTNMVVSTKEDYDPFGGLTFKSISSAIEYASERNVEELFIVGGVSVFNQVINSADKLYVSILDDPALDAGEKFTNLNYDDWNLISEETATDKFLVNDLIFRTYERNS